MILIQYYKYAYLFIYLVKLRPCLVHLKNQKYFKIFCQSNLAAHAWSIKYNQKQKLTTQFACKSRDESFESS